MQKKRTIDPKYILSFILRFFIIIFIGFGIFGLFTAIILNRNVGPDYFSGISALSRIQYYLPAVILITAFVQALTLCIIAVPAILVWSHSISGPLVRFRKHLKDIAHGKILNSSLTFRDTDQLQAIAQALSEMAIAFNNHNAKALELLVQAQKMIDETKTLENQKKPDSHKLSQNIDKLRNFYGQIKKIYAVQENRLRR